MKYSIRLDQIKGLAALSDPPTEYELRGAYWLVSMRQDHQDYQAIRDLCIEHKVSTTIAEKKHCAYKAVLGVVTDDELTMWQDADDWEELMEYWRDYLRKQWSNSKKNAGKMKGKKRGKK